MKFYRSRQKIYGVVLRYTLLIHRCETENYHMYKGHVFNKLERVPGKHILKPIQETVLALFLNHLYGLHSDL